MQAQGMRYESTHVGNVNLDARQPGFFRIRRLIEGGTFALLVLVVASRENESGACVKRF